MRSTDVSPEQALLAAQGIETITLRESPASRRLLVVYAHPDDESFGNAGTILRYTSAGVAVHYACATRGEAGEVRPELLAGFNDLGELRTRELEAAAHVLGLHAVHLLNWRDSGMAGSPGNQHPRALVQAPTTRVAAQVVALIRLLRPQVVLTFGPYGGYGHPDHKKIHLATVVAFAAAGDPQRFPEVAAPGIAPWHAQRLYYPTFTTRLLRLMLPIMRLSGQDPRQAGTNQDVDFVAALRESTPVTTTIDTSAYTDQKLRAWECHHSQMDGMFARRLPRTLRPLLLGAEHYTRVYPTPGPGRERDLFAGI